MLFHATFFVKFETAEFKLSLNRSTQPHSLFQRDYGASPAAASTATVTDHVYRLPKYVSSGLGGGSTNFSLAECKDEEDASRKKEVDDLISKYAPKNVDKHLEQVGFCLRQ